MPIMHDNDVNLPRLAPEGDALCAEQAQPADSAQDATVSVRIPGHTAFIPIARQTVDALGEKLRLSQSDRAAVKLAVGEACNNAVLHPSASQATPQVTVSCRVLPDTLEIDITNQGNGFHPNLGAKMPDAELLSEHGRGIALMEMMMDSVEYLSIKGNTVVRMRKRLPETT